MWTVLLKVSIPDSNIGFSYSVNVCVSLCFPVAILGDLLHTGLIHQIVYPSGGLEVHSAIVATWIKEI